MDISRAREIVSLLAEGVDPTTGEVLPNNSVCNKGEVVRALYTVLSYLGEDKPKKNMPTNAGKPWSKEDEDLLIELYQSGSSKKEICNTLQRTVAGIAARLVHLGIIERRDTFRDRK